MMSFKIQPSIWRQHAPQQQGHNRIALARDVVARSEPRFIELEPEPRREARLSTRFMEIHTPTRRGPRALHRGGVDRDARRRLTRLRNIGREFIREFGIERCSQAAVNGLGRHTLGQILRCNANLRCNRRVLAILRAIHSVPRGGPSIVVIRR